MKYTKKLSIAIFTLILANNFALLYAEGSPFFNQKEDAARQNIWKLLRLTWDSKQLIKEATTIGSGFAIAAYLGYWKRFTKEIDSENKSKLTENFIAEPTLKGLSLISKNKEETLIKKLIAYGSATLISHASLWSLSLWKPKNHYINLFLSGANLPIAMSTSLTTALFLQEAFQAKYGKNPTDYENKKNRLLAYESALTITGLTSAYSAEHRRISNTMGQMIIPILISNPRTNPF